MRDLTGAIEASAEKFTEELKQRHQDLNLELPKEKEKLKAVVSKWVDDYDAAMKQLARIAGEPYWTSHAELAEIEKQLEQQAKANPVLSLLLPATGAYHKNPARREACLAATKLLTAACLIKAKTGKFPASLDDMKALFPQGLPLDPFTGKDFIYRLDADLPTVVAQGDAPEVKKERPQLFVFSLAAIKKREAERIKRWPAEFEEHKKFMEEPAKEGPKPQPREKVDDVF